MKAQYGEKIRIAIENVGESSLARDFGIKRYPVVFVNDVLVSKPKDFGFYGKGEGQEAGRYVPWNLKESQDRFSNDLKKMIDLTLSGKVSDVRKFGGAQKVESTAANKFPNLAIKDIDNKQVSIGNQGRVTIVEFWATWCPPCRSLMPQLSQLQYKFDSKVDVLALAVESDEKNVRDFVKQSNLQFSWAMATPEIKSAFGDINSVPAVFVYDQKGSLSAEFFGAPPDLHAKIEKAVGQLLKR